VAGLDSVAGDESAGEAVTLAAGDALFIPEARRPAAAPRAREAAGPNPSAAERPARTGRDGSTRSSLRRTPRQSTSGGPATAGLPRAGPPDWERSAAPQWRSVPWRAAGARGKLRTLRGAPWRSWCAPCTRLRVRLRLIQRLLGGVAY
jgi:hypothetical protein